jgi:hypothetical protein
MKIKQRASEAKHKGSKAKKPIARLKASSTVDVARLRKLAKQINAEHEAASSALTEGLQHAMAAGRLLTEAKAAMPHGEWLSWLTANCSASQRTAQAYMRVAKGFAEIGDEEKAQRVADLSFRDSLKMLAVTGSAAGLMASKSFERASELASDVGWRSAISRAKREHISAHALQTPRALLPTPTGRKMRVARNPTQRQWMLAWISTAKTPTNVGQAN